MGASVMQRAKAEQTNVDNFKLFILPPFSQAALILWGNTLSRCPILLNSSIYSSPLKCQVVLGQFKEKVMIPMSGFPIEDVSDSGYLKCAQE
jgi:hypothetical protein